MAKKELMTRSEVKAAKAAATKMNKPNDLEKKINEIVDLINNTFYEERHKLKLFSALGIGCESGEADYYTCHKCGKILPVTKFYVSTEVGCESGITPICKDCASDLTQPISRGIRTNPTKDTVISALEYLRKPYLDTVWDASLLEAANTVTGRTKNNVWNSYIKNIQLPNYYGLTYKESDFFTGGQYSIEDTANISRDQEIIETFEKNKLDVLRLIGYLPFEKEKTTDQPFLYAQLVGFLDSSEEGNEDMMRVSSIISIVRGFLQINQLDDTIATLTQDVQNANKNFSNIRALNATKKSVSDTITSLARESCVSLKNTKQAKKGENTWTGKIKKIKELNLREGDINGFDLMTCKGMMQVMELSDASIMKQLNLDESEWSDMIAEQRTIVRDLQNKLDFYCEASRLLLRENLDLRDTLSENGLLNERNLLDLEELYSPLMSDYLNSNAEGDEVINSASEVSADE